MPSSAWHASHPAIHSFPTRRSSDLVVDQPRHAGGLCVHDAEEPLARPRVFFGRPLQRIDEARQRRQRRAQLMAGIGDEIGAHLLDPRSEEHTSELQSPCNLVCRLLLGTPRTLLSTLSLLDALPIWSSISRAMRVACVCMMPRNRSRARASSLAGPCSVSMKPDSAASGVRSSWLALATKSARISSTRDRKSTRLNSSHLVISYAVFCLARLAPCYPLFPYSTLFRSGRRSAAPCGWPVCA